MSSFFLIISKYGYLGIFVSLMLGIIGIPLPDETLLTFAGYLVHEGYLKLFPTILIAFLGSSCGISVSYILGRTVGVHVLKKYGKYFHFTEERLEKTHLWFEKIGRWSLTIGFFVPGVRHITAIFAGSSKLKYYEFAIFAYTGGLIWTITFVLTGYFVGKEWNKYIDKVESNAAIIIAVTLALAALICLVKYFYKKNKSR
jgi:membrane protein DedA with SNARE-associated domain